jgi:TonB-dependent receptor
MTHFVRAASRGPSGLRFLLLGFKRACTGSSCPCRRRSSRRRSQRTYRCERFAARSPNPKRLRWTVQKNSDSLVTVAASDSVGRLPDQNIAQATGRLPGVAVERDQGQARYISLRGAPNYWTTLSFDGINVVSPEGRDARFDSIPSAIASQIVVSKAVTPDMPGETVSGNVNVITRSAFDYAGLHVAGQGRHGLMPNWATARNTKARLSCPTASRRATARSACWFRAASIERAHDYRQFRDSTGSASARISARQPWTRFWAQETENKLYRLTRRNWSVSGRLDWQPDSRQHHVAALGLYDLHRRRSARQLPLRP